MPELFALFVLITLSLLVVRIGTIALVKTGLSREVAAFQAQSAFMAVGFTTTEAESVVGHPVRRRIVQTLMLLGFGAVTSTVGTMVVTFAQEREGMAPGYKILILLLFVIGLAVIVHVRVLDRLLDRIIAAALGRMTSLNTLDLHELLEADKGYTVAMFRIGDGNWMAGRNLRQLALADEGILVLNVHRGETGVVIASPASRTRMHAGDQVLVYGLEEDLADLQHRPTGDLGDQGHQEAVARQRMRMVGERSEDEAAESARQEAG